MSDQPALRPDPDEIIALLHLHQRRAFAVYHARLRREAAQATGTLQWDRLSSLLTLLAVTLDERTADQRDAAGQREAAR